MRTPALPALAGALLAAAAQAGSVYVNSPLAVINAELGSVGQAKYRLSHANFDMSLDNGAGTTNPNFASAHLGHNAALSARTYRVVVEHLAGEGFTFRMTHNGATTAVSWGSFGAAPGGAVAGTLNGAAPGAPFNGLLIEARATRAGSSMSFANLSFTSLTLGVADGAWASGVVDPGVAGPGDANGFWTQRLVADTDLSLHDWRFEADVLGSRDAVASGDETVRFVVSAKRYDATITTVVPLPGPAGLGLAGLAALGARRRRR